MKKGILILLLLSSACVKETPAEKPVIKPVELRCANIKNKFVPSTDRGRAEFFADVLEVFGQQGSECSPKEAAALLDSIFEIHCDELCQIREK
jgi:hypothetical protein